MSTEQQPTPPRAVGRIDQAIAGLADIMLVLAEIAAAGDAATAA